MRNRLLAALLLTSMLILSGCDTSAIAPTSGVKAAKEKEALAREQVALAADESKVSDNQEAVANNGETSETVSLGEETEQTENEEVFRSIFTGLETTYNWLDHRPLAVMLNNIKEGCPQSGIEKASVVYECPVEGRITRLMGIFEKYEEIPKIGSIRSSRDYFVYLALEFDAIYAHFGQATIYVGDLLNSEAVDNISGAVSGIEHPAPNAFYRSADRKAPHNVYISNEGLKKDIEYFGYRSTLRTGFKTKFTYPELGQRVTYDNEAGASVIYPGGKDSSARNGFAGVQARFEYNKEDKKYYRYQYGDKHIDGETGNQLTYDNVIFQYCNGIVRDNKDYLAFGLLGDNEYPCKVFTNGKVVDGTWKRTEIYEPAKYYDKDGNEIAVNYGKTWICLIWNDYANDIVVE